MINVENQIDVNAPHALTKIIKSKYVLTWAKYTVSGV